MVFIDESPQHGLQERVRKDLGVYELSEVRGAGMFFVLKALKRADIISARVTCALGIRSRRWHRG